MSDLAFNDREGFNIQLPSAGPEGSKDVNFDVMLQILSDDSDVLPEDPTNPLLAGEGRSLRHTRVETRSIPDQVGDARNGRIAKAESGEALANPHGHVSTDHTQIVQDFILESLACSAMKDREEDVIEAHGKTLDWLFSAKPGIAADGPVANFPTWRRGDQSIFWVNGKAGSGNQRLCDSFSTTKRPWKSLGNGQARDF